MPHRHHLCSAQVFDRVQQLAVCGAGLAMNPNGLAALKAISPDLLKHVSKSHSAVETLVVHRPDGESYAPTWVPTMNLGRSNSHCSHH